MKNEVMARAITEIDDELIVSAHRSVKSERNFIKYFGALAAACLLLICGVVFLIHKDTDKPKLVFGEPVISTQQSKIATYDLWQAYQTVITVPIEIEHGLEITAVDGTVCVYSEKTNERIYEGQSFEAKGSEKVEWTVEDPDTDKTYKIKINNTEKVYMLRYDLTNGQWAITETEE